MMTHQQWDTIRKSLAGFSVGDKLELVEYLRQSVRDETSAPDRTRQQGEALRQLCEKLEAMPTAVHGDGLTNRDHDRILYTHMR